MKLLIGALLLIVIVVAVNAVLETNKPKPKVLQGGLGAGALGAGGRALRGA